MKAIRIVVMVIMVIVTLFSAVYANVQTGYAAEMKALVEVNKAEATRQEELAEQQSQRADAVALKAKETMLKLEACEAIN